MTAWGDYRKEGVFRPITGMAMDATLPGTVIWRGEAATSAPPDTAREATSDEVKGLRREATALKEVVADLTLENRLLKKSMVGDGEDGA